MDLDRRVCDRARKSRDARFDGRFFIAVKTTGIYCRPICPARTPKDENVRYFATAAAAEAAGFRPCLRCRPEASPGSPAWLGTSGIVSRALRMIGDGALRDALARDGRTGVAASRDDDTARRARPSRRAERRAETDAGVEALADRLGVTARHLRRLFLQHLGATPLDVALTRRVHSAKKLIDETDLAFHQVAIAAGFGSLRRFNGEIRRVYARTPSELRRLARRQRAADPDCYRFRLSFRPPYDWDAVLAFLGARATPGVELVQDSRYRRTIAIDGRHGSIDVAYDAGGSALILEVCFPDPRSLLFIVERVKAMFDLGADPAVVADHLRADPLLAGAIAQHPGIRMPGAWDGFELAVRAILGQQISVRGATTIAGRVAAMCGTPVSGPDGLGRLFPTPAQLAAAPIEHAGIVGSRPEAIRGLARRTADGTIAFTCSADPRDTIAAL